MEQRMQTHFTFTMQRMVSEEISDRSLDTIKIKSGLAQESMQQRWKRFVRSLGALDGTDSGSLFITQVRLEFSISYQLTRGINEMYGAAIDMRELETSQLWVVHKKNL